MSNRLACKVPVMSQLQDLVQRNRADHSAVAFILKDVVHRKISLKKTEIPRAFHGLWRDYNGCQDSRVGLRGLPSYRLSMPGFSLPFR